MTRALRSPIALAVFALLASATVLLLAGDPALAQPGGPRSFGARLTSVEEVPAILVPGTGLFSARIDNNGVVDYRLAYAGLTSNVVMAHIHVAQKGVNGGIIVWLCGTAGAPGPAGTPTCDGTTEGVVEGSFDAADVQAIGSATSGQGVAAGDFGDLLRAIREGVAYANVHTTNFGSGELRGQIRRGARGNDGDDDDD